MSRRSDSVLETGIQRAFGALADNPLYELPKKTTGQITSYGTEADRLRHRICNDERVRGRFLAKVKELELGDVWKLEGRFDTAGQLRDAISSRPAIVNKAGIFVIRNTSSVAKGDAAAAIKALLDAADSILIRPVRYAVKGDSPDTERLDSTLRDHFVGGLRRDALVSSALDQLYSSAASCMGRGEREVLLGADRKIVRAAFVILLGAESERYGFDYCFDMDTLGGGKFGVSLRDGLKRSKRGGNLCPGFVPAPAGIAKAVSKGCSDDHQYSPALRKVAASLSAASVSGQALVDPVHQRLFSEMESVLVHAGVNASVGIASWANTKTPPHVEDCLLASLNALWLGWCKHWCSLCPELGGVFSQWLVENGEVAAARGKMMHGHDRWSPAWLEEVEWAGMMPTQLLQFPGYSVATLAGYVWHSTVSIGTSFAEAVNCAIGMEVPGVAEAQEAELRLALSLQKDPVAGSWAKGFMLISETLFNAQFERSRCGKSGSMLNS